MSLCRLRFFFDLDFSALCIRKIFGHGFSNSPASCRHVGLCQFLSRHSAFKSRHIFFGTSNLVKRFRFFLCKINKFGFFFFVSHLRFYFFALQLDFSSSRCSIILLGERTPLMILIGTHKKNISHFQHTARTYSTQPSGLLWVVERNNFNFFFRRAESCEGIEKHFQCFICICYVWLAMTRRRSSRTDEMNE